MIAVSTSFIQKNIVSGKELTDRLDRLDIRAVELEYRITADIYKEIRPYIKKTDIRVTSVHNFFPVPPEHQKNGGGGDLFNLAHPDKEIRNTAVSRTVATIEHAHDLEASVVVIHGGFVDMETEREFLRRCVETTGVDSDETREFIARKTAEVAAKKRPYIDGLYFSLEKLIPVAEKKGIRLGLENRYRYHQLPGYEDFGPIFSTFEGGPLGYWHDTGHAWVQELLGACPRNGFLDAFGGKLIGAHLHDAEGLQDHLPPGDGAIDFSSLKARLAPDALRVMELRPGTDDAGVLRGLNHLRGLGMD